MDENIVTEARQLTTEQRKAALSVLRNIPIALLPSMGSPTLRTTADVDDLISIIEHMGKAATLHIQQLDETQDQLNSLRADLKAAGRVLALMGLDTGGPSARDAFKATWSAAAIRPELTADDVKAIAAKMGIDL